MPRRSRLPPAVATSSRSTFAVPFSTPAFSATLVKASELSPTSERGKNSPEAARSANLAMSTPAIAPGPKLALIEPLAVRNTSASPSPVPRSVIEKVPRETGTSVCAFIVRASAPMSMSSPRSLNSTSARGPPRSIRIPACTLPPKAPASEMSNAARPGLT